MTGGAPSPRIALAIMAKAPQPGEVKTRLCPPLTAVQAAELSRAFLLDKLEQVRSVAAAAPVVAFTPEAARDDLARLAPGVALLAQRGAGLGERLAAVLSDLRALGHPGAVLLDTDTPTLPRPWLAEAVRVLEEQEADVIVGPTEDGGYYLLGTAREAPGLFEAIPWSTSHVLARTLERAEDLGLRTRLLPPWFDVDTGADLDRLAATLKQPGDHGAPHTRAALSALGRV